MALSKADKWLVAVLVGVFVIGLGTLTAGTLFIRAVTRNFAQSEASGHPPPLEWEHIFTRGVFSRGNCVKQTADGGFIVAAMVNTGEADELYEFMPEQNMHLLKTDPGGSLEWEQVLSTDGRSSPVSVWQADDGGYVVIGNTVKEPDAGPETATEGAEALLDHSAIVLIKTDGGGNPEWEKIFIKDVSCRAEMGLQAEDGGFIVVGTISPAANPGAEGGSPGIYLLKTDRAGEVEWEKVLALREFSHEVAGDPALVGSAGRHVEQALDGGYIVIGPGEFELPGKIALIKTDRFGEIEQEFVIPTGSFFPASYAFTRDPGGGYVFAGNNLGNTGVFASIFNPSISLIKLDAAGEPEWEREFRRYRGVSAIQQAPGGGYLILTDSFTFFPFPNLLPALVKTDTQGGLLWVKTLTRAGEDPLALFFVSRAVPAADGGYIVTGCYENGIYLAKIGTDF